MDTKLIEDWITYHSQEKGGPHLFWACERLYRLVEESPEDAWNYILEIANSSNNELVLAILAAGPLEDLLVYHGELIIDRLITESRRNSHLAKTVLGVWQNAIIPEVWKRVQMLQKELINSNIDKRMKKE